MSNWWMTTISFAQKNQLQETLKINSMSYSKRLKHYKKFHTDFVLKTPKRTNKSILIQIGVFEIFASGNLAQIWTPSVCCIQIDQKGSLETFVQTAEKSSRYFQVRWHVIKNDFVNFSVQQVLSLLKINFDTKIFAIWQHSMLRSIF